mmetsp:Transcript_6434/g.18390  ORF Transcript_6434/g.18390 Transcript_6434/m.18390 type:complete len:282 (-) Transcript_6434:1241-2086(-)
MRALGDVAVPEVSGEPVVVQDNLPQLLGGEGYKRYRDTALPLGILDMGLQLLIQEQGGALQPFVPVLQVAQLQPMRSTCDRRLFCPRLVEQGLKVLDVFPHLRQLVQLADGSAQVLDENHFGDRAVDVNDDEVLILHGNAALVASPVQRQWAPPQVFADGAHPPLRLPRLQLRLHPQGLHGRGIDCDDAIALLHLHGRHVLVGLVPRVDQAAGKDLLDEEAALLLPQAHAAVRQLRRVSPLRALRPIDHDPRFELRVDAVGEIRHQVPLVGSEVQAPKRRF